MLLSVPRPGQPREPVELKFPFIPGQAGKRKPALTAVALTMAVQLPRMWGNDRAALGRHASSFLGEIQE